MTSNISYLSDYEPFDGGYVSFGQGGCKITRKGTIKTGKLEFENVYFVKDLKDLTCLVAKASADECMLWHRRLGFLKPFGCHVMILNTLDNLGKFEAKGDEGYFIGYSMSSKAFRVFNKRTKRVKENLHIEFLENKAIEKGAGSNWLFDIDSLTKSMNYVLVVDADTNSTNFSGTKDGAGQEVKKDVSTLRYITLPNWAHDSFLESSSSKSQDDCNSDVPESSGNLNPTATSTNSPADHIETLTVETPIPTVSPPVLTACFTDSQEPSSETRLI
nr:ribonuclease H-like domain-containing protein [Tanacetum cinerariifolium]